MAASYVEAEALANAAKHAQASEVTACAHMHPEMTTTGNTNTSLTVPAIAEAASRYQRLRGHLTALKLHAAAEALPTVMDQAATEQLSLTAALERLLAIEVDATEARRLAGRLRSAHPCHPGRF